MRARFPAHLVVLLVLAGAYVVAGKIGLRLAFVHASAIAVWPPTGIALAALLLLGYRVWPGIFVGAFLVNVTTEGTIATSLGIAVGNTLEGLTGAYLVNRFARGREAFERAQDIVKYTFLAGMVSPAVAATVGVSTLTLGGFARWSDYGAIWFTWWLGDAVGALVVAPCLILWTRPPRRGPDGRRLRESLLLLAGLSVVGSIVFGGWLPASVGPRPLEFLCIPFLVWAAYRLGQRQTAAAAVLLSALAISGTLRGLGSFAGNPPNESLLLLQAFIGVNMVMALVFGAVVAESRRGAAALARVASIVESSDDAIIAKGLDGTILNWNAGASRVYGYTAEEAIGHSIAILSPPDRQDEVPNLLERLARGERIESFETVRMRKDGRSIAVSLTVSPFTDSRGRIIGASTIARDVTERRRTEETTRQAEALLSVTRLAHTAAHEINNPLAAIVGQLQLLVRQRDDDPELAARLQRTLESVWRIRDIVARMQRITRLELVDQSPGLPEILDLTKSTPESETPTNPRA
jgi:PAS domain S-box-containing protein